ncbi:hypothetical protein CPB83DRAFT_860036 [Crepidotus variabilis]|uniref:Uncharacterized protein n=1 Tax=Crepidotus variabilis TaxID=179855 RepID=A0A9P6E9S8_9AGAR|nr:hypothetical protein CPB83DRAFT_860036 [Crepidotus variabilis]
MGVQSSFLSTHSVSTLLLSAISKPRGCHFHLFKLRLGVILLEYVSTGTKIYRSDDHWLFHGFLLTSTYLNSEIPDGIDILQ